MAPYLAAIGSSLAILSFSPEIELMSMRPGYRRNAVSIVSTLGESTASGRSVIVARKLTTFLMVDGSSMPWVPTFTSRRSAPCLS